MDEQKYKQSMDRKGSEQSTIPSLATGPLYLREHQEIPTVEVRRERNHLRPPRSHCPVGRKQEEGVSCAIVTLFDSDGVQQHRQFMGFQAQAASVIQHVGNLIEGLHQP